MMDDEMEIEQFNLEQPPQERDQPDPLESDAALRCEKLQKMDVGAQFAVCWKTHRKLVTEDWAREFVSRDSPWDRLFELSYIPTYREILVDFLSSFEFHPRRPDQVVDPAQPLPPPEVCFRMAGQAHSMSLAVFAVHSDLYTEAEIATDPYTTIHLTQILYCYYYYFNILHLRLNINLTFNKHLCKQGLVMADKPTLLGFLAVIADIRHWDHVSSKGRVTLIHDPLFSRLRLRLQP
ncbi:hypothetical protein HanPI659440_Chr02g0080211 [Helianthus annuus]|nr:hypothetical protein HanPI659440_Chr02g0080211 [Helianthus annuus]